MDIGSLLRFTSYVVDVTYEDQQQTQQQQDQQQQHHALVAVEVRAVVSKPEEKQTTHTNTFRCGVGNEGGKCWRRSAGACRCQWCRGADRSIADTCC